MGMTPKYLLCVMLNPPNSKLFSQCVRVLLDDMLVGDQRISVTKESAEAKSKSWRLSKRFGDIRQAGVLGSLP